MPKQQSVLLLSMDHVKQQINSVFLQLQLAGKELMVEINALESLLKTSYEQNKLAQDLAKDLTINSGKPVANVITLQETIAEKRRTLDNLYSLDDRLKLLDKEVSKAKDVLQLLKVENPKSEDKQHLLKLTSEIDNSLARLTMMNLDFEKQVVKGTVLGQDTATPDACFGAVFLKRHAAALNNVTTELYKVTNEIKLRSHALPMEQVVAQGPQPTTPTKRQ